MWYDKRKRKRGWRSNPCAFRACALVEALYARRHITARKPSRLRQVLDTLF